MASARASVTSCSSLGQRRRHRAFLDRLDVGRRLCGGRRVPAVGRQHRATVAPDQDRRVAARQPGEVPDVDQPGDQGDVGAGVGEGGRHPGPALGVHCRHGADLIAAEREPMDERDGGQVRSWCR
jgi:hypothetical protein